MEAEVEKKSKATEKDLGGRGGSLSFFLLRRDDAGWKNGWIMLILIRIYEAYVPFLPSFLSLHNR